MKLTNQNGSTISVYMDNVKQSSHTDVKEAIEKAVNLSEANKGKRVVYRYEDKVGKPFEVLVEATSSTIPIPPTHPSNLNKFFSVDSWQNKKDAQTAPLHSNSVNLIADFCSTLPTYAPWINNGQYSVPLYIVDNNTPLVKVTIIGDQGQPQTGTKLYAECQKGVPVPANAIPAGGTDASICIYNKDSKKMWEFWIMKGSGTSWTARWGGIINDASVSNGVCPMETNSAGGPERWGSRATGMALIGGIMLYEELKAGVIPHALAMAIGEPSNKFVPPATATDGSDTRPNKLSEGMRLRLPSSATIDPNAPPILKMIMQAAKDYGIYVTDRAGATVFCIEDCTQYGKTESQIKAEFYGGKEPWDFMPWPEKTGSFPWSKLQVVQP